MSAELILQFLARGDDFNSKEDIIAAIEAIVDSFGFISYAILRHPRPNDDVLSLLLTSRWPEGWPDHYVAKKYIVVDPTVRYLGHARYGFRWRDALPAFQADPQHKRMERMMADARKRGLEDGYIFPIHGRRGLIGNMSVGGPPIDLSRRDVALFETLARRAFWMLLDRIHPDISGRMSTSVDVILTRREMEALAYLADGLTSNDIAHRLEISSNTVDWYMNGIQSKLKAKNRQHAVAIAFRLGLIS